MFDQRKMGGFMKELRKEKVITQEQFAEVLNVSARTVSRWETGSSMPDISLLVEIANFYDVDITELINGERKSEIMNNNVDEVTEALTDYADKEKKLLTKRVAIIDIIGFITLISGLIMEHICPNSEIPVYETLKGFFFGFAIGSFIVMILYCTGNLAKIRKSRSARGMKFLFILCSVVLILTLILSIVFSIIK